MNPIETNSSLSPWSPLRFCVVLSATSVVSNLLLTVINKREVGGWSLAFLCFLPTCFYFVGAVMSRMQNEIRDLRHPVADLGGD